MNFRLINSKTWFLFVLLILFFAFLTQSWFFSQSNEFLRVIGVKDGDTVVLLTAAKTEITVRLSEIDAPERKQAFELFPVLSFLTLFLEKKLSWKKWVLIGTVVPWALFICKMVRMSIWKW